MMRLVADDLCIDRGERRILSDASFTLAVGQALLITGDNGAGKSSLLRVLAGLLTPASGSVRLERAGEGPPPLHYLGHRDALKAPLTARENLAFAGDYLAADETGDPLPALSAFGVEATADVPVAWLSTGMRRRVALSRLLVARRPLWLLDEPTAGLDAASVVRFEKIVSDHLAGGGLLVAATHQPLRFPARELRLGATDSVDARD